MEHDLVSAIDHLHKFKPGSKNGRRIQVDSAEHDQVTAVGIVINDLLNIGEVIENRRKPKGDPAAFSDDRSGQITEVICHEACWSGHPWLDVLGTHREHEHSRTRVHRD